MLKNKHEDTRAADCAKVRFTGLNATLLQRVRHFATLCSGALLCRARCMYTLGTITDTQISFLSYTLPPPTAIILPIRATPAPAPPRHARRHFSNRKLPSITASNNTTTYLVNRVNTRKYLHCTRFLFVCLPRLFPNYSFLIYTLSTLNRTTFSLDNNT